ncbi:hypothetical protein [Stutzerimonas kunmingensis]|uniref:hypothetical protein n=1 Tax=Stutzerimonas kunmingensis TaxID=1211807 RepID=UPI001F471A99|nr:hypothetical protein [Stutzerimonas kunmingensis]UIP34204.1 hypothetical protein LW136_07145 [Stutzerimonas kunmingensis]
MEWFPALTSTGLLVLAMWLGRNLITARLTNAVRYEYDVKIETLKSELAASQKIIDSEVRLRESQTEALRSGALSGLANRKGELFKKRLDAIDQLWGTLVALGPGKVVAITMSSIKFEEALKRSERDQSTRDFFKTISSNFDPKSISTVDAAKVRPYVSKMAWALFSAYSSIIGMAVLRMMVLQNGIGKDFTNKESMIKLVEATLPHQKKLIDDHGLDAIYYLLDELEGKLLQEIENMLEGEIDDRESVKRAAGIMNVVREIEKESRLNGDGLI